MNTFKSYRTELMNQIKQGNDQALIELGVNITAQAKSLAPVDFGQLRNSIQWKTKQSQGGFQSGHDIIGQSGKTFQGGADGNPIETTVPDGVLLVGATAKHAVYQEFGTRNMKPQPFLRPAIRLFLKGNKTATTVGKIINNWLKKYPNKAVPK